MHVRARRLLLAVLQVTTAREVALRVRVHESNVSRWLSGESRPSLLSRIRLQSNYRIPIAAWRELVKTRVS